MVISMVLFVVYALDVLQHIGKGLCVIIMVSADSGSAGLLSGRDAALLLPVYIRCSPSRMALMRCVKSSEEEFYGHTYLSLPGGSRRRALVAFAIGLALRPFLVSLNAMVTRDLASSVTSPRRRVPSTAATALAR